MALKSYEELIKVDVRQYCEERDGFTYLNWAKCIELLRQNGATEVYWEPIPDPQTGSSLRKTDIEFKDKNNNTNRCYETYLGLDTVGVAEFFALLYIAYEVVSIFKNMALCGLPVKKVWEKVREFLAKYTDELPDTDELDGDSTTGNVEEHRTQER